MKPHNEAALGVGKLTVLVLALVAGAGMAGAFGDSKTAPDFSTLFQVHDQKPAKKAKKDTGPSEPPPMTCEGDQCWWTDLGRPNG